MLPLNETGLSTADEWHALEDVLVVCKHSGSEAGREAYDALPLHLREHPIGQRIAVSLDASDADALDRAACDLAHRTLPDAWTLLERL